MEMWGYGKWNKMEKKKNDVDKKRHINTTNSTDNELQTEVDDSMLEPLFLEPRIYLTIHLFFLCFYNLDYTIILIWKTLKEPE